MPYFMDVLLYNSLIPAKWSFRNRQVCLTVCRNSVKKYVLKTSFGHKKLKAFKRIAINLINEVIAIYLHFHLTFIHSEYLQQTTTAPNNIKPVHINAFYSIHFFFFTGLASKEFKVPS